MRLPSIAGAEALQRFERLARSELRIFSKRERLSMKSMESQLFVGLFIVFGIILMWDCDVWSLVIAGGIGYWAYTVLFGEQAMKGRHQVPPTRHF